MPKLPPITPKKLLKILNKCGFHADHATGSHIILYNPENKKRAVVPFHLKDLPKGTLASILAEIGISKNDFLKLLGQEPH
ncbi:MAG: type II toxin-antitoxin system HicA family toxin [Patescibacteria group bacterium]